MSHLNPNDPLVIRRVANGYVVTYAPHPMHPAMTMPSVEPETHVFPTRRSLTRWLAKHFPDKPITTKTEKATT